MRVEVTTRCRTSVSPQLHVLNRAERERLVNEVIDETFGLGRRADDERTRPSRTSSSTVPPVYRSNATACWRLAPVTSPTSNIAATSLQRIVGQAGTPGGRNQSHV